VESAVLESKCSTSTSIVVGGGVCDYLTPLLRAADCTNYEMREQTVSLTKRELEVLHWIVNGKTTKNIADILGIAVTTVAAHRANIMKAVGVRKTVDLVVYAIQHSLVSIPVHSRNTKAASLEWVQ